MWGPGHTTKLPARALASLFRVRESATAACPRPIDSNPIRHTHPTPVVSATVPRTCHGAAARGVRGQEGAGAQERAAAQQEEEPADGRSRRRGPHRLSKQACVCCCRWGAVGREGQMRGAMRVFLKHVDAVVHVVPVCVNWAGLAGSINRSIRSHRRNARESESESAKASDRASQITDLITDLFVTDGAPINRPGEADFDRQRTGSRDLETLKTFKK